MAIVAGAGAWLFFGFYVMLPLFMDSGGAAASDRLINVVASLYMAVCVLAGVLGGYWVFFLTRTRLPDPMMQKQESGACAKREP